MIDSDSGSADDTDSRQSYKSAPRVKKELDLKEDADIKLPGPSSVDDKSGIILVKQESDPEPDTESEPEAIVKLEAEEEEEEDEIMRGMRENKARLDKQKLVLDRKLKMDAEAEIAMSTQVYSPPSRSYCPRWPSTTLTSSEKIIAPSEMYAELLKDDDSEVWCSTFDFCFSPLTVVQSEQHILYPRMAHKVRPRFIIKDVAQASIGPHIIMPGVQIPASINMFLRSYQRAGVEFFCRQYHMGMGGILGDDMGVFWLLAVFR